MGGLAEEERSLTCRAGGAGEEAIVMGGIDGSVWPGANAATDVVESGSGCEAVSGVGVGCASFRMAWERVNGCLQSAYWVDIQATERLATGSVYFVRFGCGEEGKLGISCVMAGCGVASSAMVRKRKIVWHVKSQPDASRLDA